VTPDPALPPAETRRKRDGRRTKDADRVYRNRTERPSAEDDAIDDAIKRSIDEFGA
jgi:hypothetical protein